MMLFKKRVDRSFVSELDQLLFQFDQDHPTKSAAQQAEIDKSKRVATKRDNACYDADAKGMWDNF